MISETNVATRIKTALAEFLKRDVAVIHAHHALRNDLGLDSMARIELLYNLEDVFGFQIPDQDLAGLVTVADVIAYVEARAAPTTERPIAPKQPAVEVIK